MFPHPQNRAFATALLVSLLSVQPLAQEPPTASVQSTPLVALVDFDFAATGLWWMSEFVGKGVADLLTDELINAGPYRIMERKYLAAVLAEQKLGSSSAAGEPQLNQVGKILRAQYLIVGSVTRFGTEKQSAGGLGGTISGLAGFGQQKGKAVVAITARVVRVETGEVVVSVQGEGTSKRSGILLGGFVPGVGAAGFSMGSSEYRDSILGEATLFAVKQVVQKLVAAKSQLVVGQ